MVKIEIGKKVALLRKEARLTQFELAEKSGIGQAHLAHIEKGDYNSSIHTLSKIADALGCTIDFIKK